MQKQLHYSGPLHSCSRDNVQPSIRQPALVWSQSSTERIDLTSTERPRSEILVSLHFLAGIELITSMKYYLGVTALSRRRLKRSPGSIGAKLKECWVGGISPFHHSTIGAWKVRSFQTLVCVQTSTKTQYLGIRLMACIYLRLLSHSTP